MIQDIYPHKLDNQYRADALIEDKDFIIAFRRKEIMINKSNKIIFPTYKELKQSATDTATETDTANATDTATATDTANATDTAKFQYLFSLDKDRYFLAMSEQEEIEGYEYIEFNDMRERKMGPDYMAYVAYTACHLNSWYNNTKFCGRCGKKMTHHETERAMKCECGYRDYPRIMPAVIVGVRNGDKLLVTKYREGYKHYALIAGFTEIGETVEETVVREVMEEAGLKVKNIRYYKSQPWGTAMDILMGFFCDVDGNEEINMDANELKVAKWVTREEIELQPDGYSLTNEMMKYFKEN